MKFLTIIGLFLSFSSVEVLCFRSSLSRVAVSRKFSLYTNEQKSFQETLFSWLLPVKQVNGDQVSRNTVDEFLAKLPSDASEAYDRRFFGTVEEYQDTAVRASTLKEFLDSPAFPTDRTLFRKRPYVWPGNRPPLPNFRRLDQSMDAAWGRGKYREEIWNDVVNPSIPWTVSFEPSDEEIDAMFGTDQHAPFNFDDPEAWCKERGLDFTTVMSEWEAAREAGYKAFKEEEAAAETLVTQQEYQHFLIMKERIEKQAFRVEDDRNQNLKGQPSLEGEDDGKQFWND